MTNGTCNRLIASSLIGLAISLAILFLFQMTFADNDVKGSLPKLTNATTQAAADKQVGGDRDLISLNVTVTDPKGRSISGLDRSAFVIVDNKVPQDIASFSNVDEPVSVGIIFAFSSSMKGANVALARDALAHSIQRNNPRDEYFLLGINSRLDLTVDKMQDAEATLRQLNGLSPEGDSAMYDPVYLALEKLKRASFPKRALLLITDGRENDSHHSVNEVRSLLAESGVLLYSICVLDPIRLAHKGGMRVQDTLDRLSEVTGGLALYMSHQALGIEFGGVGRFSANGFSHAVVAGR